MEPDRASDVQPDKRQLGRGAAGQLRDDLEVHTHDTDEDRCSLPSLSGQNGLPGAAPRGGAAAPLFRDNPRRGTPSGTWTPPRARKAHHGSAVGRG